MLTVDECMELGVLLVSSTTNETARSNNRQEINITTQTDWLTAISLVFLRLMLLLFRLLMRFFFSLCAVSSIVLSTPLPPAHNYLYSFPSTKYFSTRRNKKEILRRVEENEETREIYCEKQDNGTKLKKGRVTYYIYYVYKKIAFLVLKSNVKKKVVCPGRNRFQNKAINVE